MKKSFWILIVFAAGLFIASIAMAQYDVPGTYTSIQAAINAASAGSTITVTGTHTEAGILVTKNITIQGSTSSYGDTIVQAAATRGAAANRVFNISSGVVVTIKNMTIKFGKAPGGNPGVAGENGGGILNNGTLTVNNCYITENDAGNGGAGVAGTDGGQGTTGGNGIDGADGTSANPAGQSGSSAQAGGTGTSGIAGGSGGNGGNGGGIYNAAGATLTVMSSLIEYNNVSTDLITITGGIGGNGGKGGKGGTGGNGGIGGRGGDANPIYCTAPVDGGDGGAGGAGGKGGNGASGGNGGNGGGGGGIYNAGTLNLRYNTLIQNNKAGKVGTAGSAGSAGSAGTSGSGGLGGSPACGGLSGISGVTPNSLGSGTAGNAGTAGTPGAGNNLFDLTGNFGGGMMVELVSFTGSATKDGVVLKWETASEPDNVGFHILRSETEDGEYEQITGYMILSEGTATQGSSYTYTDTDVEKGKKYYYKLEDIDAGDKSTLHGPVSVRFGKTRD